MKWRKIISIIVISDFQVVGDFHKRLHVEWLRLCIDDRLRHVPALWGEQPLVVVRLYVALQLPHRPSFLCCLLQVIIMSRIAVLHTHYQSVMGLGQLATQRVANSLIQSLYFSPILHKHTTFLSWCCTTFLTQILAATRPCLSSPSCIYSKTARKWYIISGMQKKNEDYLNWQNKNECVNVGMRECVC